MPSYSSPKGKSAPEKAILDVIEALYLSERWSDIKITCGDYVFPAHEAVVFPRSEYFRTACSGKFQDPPGLAQLTSKDPFLIEKVLEFLYKGSYSMSSVKINLPQKPAQKAGRESPSTKRQKVKESPAELTKVDCPRTGPEIAFNQAYFHARMYAEGDFFMVKELKDLAKEKFEFTLKHRFNPESFAEVSKEIYSDRTNYEELKTALVTAAIKNLAYLRDPENPILDRELFASSPGFSEDLCMAFIRKHGPKK